MDDIVISLPESAQGTTRKKFHHLKKKYPASIVLLEEGDFFYTYDGDAKKVKELAGVGIIKSQSFFSFQLMDDYLPKLNARHPVAIVYRDDEGDPSLCTVRVLDPQTVAQPVEDDRMDDEDDDFEVVGEDAERTSLDDL